MPTTVILSTGARAADSVTVNTVTSTTVSGYTNAWTVVLTATVPSTTKIGDKLTVGANSYLIVNISGSTLTVVGDAGIAFTSTTAPATGAATTARSYSSPELWSAGAPASLVTKDWIWRGEIYKEGGGTDNEWVLGAAFSDVSIVFNATTDAARHYVMTAAAGQSFRDNTNKLTNALRYNPANGVAIHLAGNFANLTGTGIANFYNLQLSVKQDFSFWGSTDPEFSSCVLYSPLGGRLVSRAKVYNCLCHNIRLQNGGATNEFIASTFVSNNSTAFGNTTGGNITIRNCAVFGYTSFGAGANAATSTHNVTDLASFGWSATGNLVSKTFANQFQSITGGSEDFRIKAGADLINAGARDQTYTNDLDIVGTTRSLTTPTIGAWEYPTVTYTYSRPSSDVTTQWTPSTGTAHFALIDETTANDTDYIYATAAGQTDEVRLASMTAPQAGTDLLINYKVTGIVGSATVTMSLRQGSGGTLIATDTAKNTDNTYQLVVPAATWASVTDWTDLRLRFVSA